MTTSINFHLRPSARTGRHTRKLFIRIIHARQCRHISRNYSVFPDEWSAENKSVILPQEGVDSARSHYLTTIDKSMKNDLKRLNEIVLQLSERGNYSASDVAEWFADSMGRSTLRGYAELTAFRLHEQGRERTARAYRSAVRSLTAFNGGKDMALSQMDASLMAEYEKHLFVKGLKQNTVSFYLRNLRALYFRAVSERLIPQQPSNPFAGLHTGVYETRRRALDDRQLKSLAKLDTVLCGSKHAQLHDALLLFMFCYHARGMSFVDMAHLKKENFNAEILTYRRRKTGGLMEIKVTEPMWRILLYFQQKTERSEYLFPVIIGRKYETGLKNQNSMLKILAQMAGIQGALSTHAARHTWATLAKRMHVPVAVIGEALGHRDVKTTSIYLASFDRATMDELSEKMSKVANVA